MIQLLGPSALPAFRLTQIADRLSALAGRKLAVTATDLYLLDCNTLPDGLAGQRLLSLLKAKSSAAAPASGDLLVLPRPGTTTAWSSKATELLRRCGLADAGRIEHGVLFHFEGFDARSLGGRADEVISDRMTQVVVPADAELAGWFDSHPPQSLGRIELGDDPHAGLARANSDMGLALSEDEIDYLVAAYRQLGREPTDAELMMFSQANSEHCRHKIFNASWTVDGVDRDGSLFGLIRQTHARNPQGVIVAYDDNAAVIEGYDSKVLIARAGEPEYRTEPRRLHFQIKVETHNHPTAISPDPGAATGAGGEIRDEAATGRGAKPVAGLTGFSVSDLRLPGMRRDWEQAPVPPGRLATPLKIMIEGPVGAARFNNEFGRPALGGYFRTFSSQLGGRLWGYHKPIMIAGGSGVICDSQTAKHRLEAGHRVIVLGGPAMLIGLGGGAASSMSAGQSREDLDYASVQRGNPEMQRRCQEVIDRCWAEGERNPIESIHDVGAGGLSNAIPELLHDGGVGGVLELREIPSADPSLSPMAIWCNEAQERYVLAVAPENLDRFAAICTRERCPWADLGPATAQGHLRLDDRLLGEPAVDLGLEILLGKAPKMHRDAVTERHWPGNDGLEGLDMDDCIGAVLRLPAVASKSFLITIGDRSVGGLTARDPMVGRHQVPVADHALTLADYEGFAGCAMAMGERTPLAVWDAPASGRMAVGEVITNLSGVLLDGLDRIKLSANWMAAAGTPGQDAALRATVEAVAGKLCPQLGLAIPVGKDSLSMQTVWGEDDRKHEMRAPVSLIVTGFAAVADVRRAVTPALQSGVASELLLIDLGSGRLGGSALAQVSGRELGAVPDLDDPEMLKSAFGLAQQLLAADLLLAVHDRSDGGLYTTLLEMALAGRVGLDISLPAGCDPLVELFAEELGLVLQVPSAARDQVLELVERAGLAGCSRFIGQPADHDRLEIQGVDGPLSVRPMSELARTWSETSHAVAGLRDDPECADEELEWAADWQRPGLAARLEFGPEQAPAIIGGDQPRVAILREQGVNGQREMARAFMAAGFEAVDVHMSDLESGRMDLTGFRGLVACGGFSFGDVLGAGQGWARSILFNDRLRQQFADFFERSDSFALGVCNGCQMLSSLAEIIPGAAAWPRFVHNRSRQFEARLSQVRIEPSPSIFLTGMAGSWLPVVTSHGEGRARFDDRQPADARICLRYIDGHGRPTERYPDNPNGSAEGITGLCSEDGRVTIMMPHPERLLRAVNFSWAPKAWGDWSPWQRMFENARAWCDDL